MDTGFTFTSARRDVLKLYAPAGFDAPDDLTMTAKGEPVRFVRLSDRSLKCEQVADRVNGRGDVTKVPGECRNPDCHTRSLGDCQCGRHSSPVAFERAAR